MPLPRRAADAYPRPKVMELRELTPEVLAELRAHVVLPPELIGPWYLWKLMIAPAAQGSGVGREVLRQAAELVKEHGATELLTSCAQGEGTPCGFYVGLGFVPTGEYAEDDEEILVLAL